MPIVGELLTGERGSATGESEGRERQRRRGVAQHEVIGARRRGETDDGIDRGVEGAVPVRTASRRPGTENVSSPWTKPPTTSDSSSPFGSAVPSGSNVPKDRLAPEVSVFSGCRTIGSTSEPMEQLGPRSTVWPTR